MKSIIAFVWCLLCLLDVASSRILRHEKTSIGAKETSRTSTNQDNILQDCLTEASGAGKTTRENQLTYFQGEFQRINTELKTVRDEMYADGGTGNVDFFFFKIFMIIHLSLVSQQHRS